MFLQFDYYQLPFCEPENIVDLPENLGEALAGEKAHTSAYLANMKVNEYCKTLCKKKYTPQQMEEFQDFAILEYRVNMRLDNLPIAEMNLFAYEDRPQETIQIYNLGYPVGSKLVDKEDPKNDQYQINNHLRFKILYHPTESDDEGSSSDRSSPARGSYIVGYQVIPLSIKHTFKGRWNDTARPYNKLSTCTQPPNGFFEPHEPMVLDPAEGGEVIWTYDVEWERSDVKWASRWDIYLKLTQVPSPHGKYD